MDSEGHDTRLGNRCGLPAQGRTDSEIESVPELNRLTVEGHSQFGGRTQYVYTQDAAADSSG